MLRCPACSSTFLRPVPLSAVSRLRARFTTKRPWGCWHCGWQAWVAVDDSDGGVPPEGGGEQPGEGTDESPAPAGSARRRA